MNRSLPRSQVLAAIACIPLGINGLFSGIIGTVAGVAAVATAASADAVVAPAAAVVLFGLAALPLYEVGMNVWRIVAGLGVLDRRSWGRDALVGWACVRLVQSLLVFVAQVAAPMWSGGEGLLGAFVNGLVLALVVNIVPAWTLWCIRGTQSAPVPPPVDAAADTLIFGRSQPAVSKQDEAFLVHWGKALFNLAVAFHVAVACIGNLVLVLWVIVAAPVVVTLAAAAFHLSTT